MLWFNPVPSCRMITPESPASIKTSTRFMEPSKNNKRKALSAFYVSTKLYNKCIVDTSFLLRESSVIIPLSFHLKTLSWSFIPFPFWFHWRLCECMWYVLPPEAMLMSTVCTVSKSHDGVHDLCCGQRLCRRPWSGLLLETMLISVIHVPMKLLWMFTVCAASKGHDGISGPSCGSGPVLLMFVVCNHTE